MKTNTKNWTAKEETKQEETGAVKKVHNLLIVDESGSMRLLYNAALSGMNESLDTIREEALKNPEQKQEVTLVTFDTGHYREIFKSEKGEKTRPLTQKDYCPSGGTPLYDAMGKAINDLRPNVKDGEAVLVTIITDGMENASCEYSLADIKALVEELDKEGWVFTYIGANQDAKAVGASMNIETNLDYSYSDKGMHDMWQTEQRSRKAFYEKTRRADYCQKDAKKNFWKF